MRSGHATITPIAEEFGESHALPIVREWRTYYTYCMFNPLNCHSFEMPASFDLLKLACINELAAKLSNCQFTRVSKFKSI